MHTCVSVWGRPSAGHVNPADDSHHEQDLDPGGSRHEDGLVQVLLHWPWARFVEHNHHPFRILECRLSCWLLALYCWPGMVEMIPQAETLRKIQVEHGVTGSFKDRPLADWLQKHNPGEELYDKVHTPGDTHICDILVMNVSYFTSVRWHNKKTMKSKWKDLQFYFFFYFVYSPGVLC